MHLGRLFQRSVKMYGNRPALAQGCGPSINYTELDHQIRALAHWMREGFNLQPGDRITLAMKNRVEYAQALLATWHAGLCAVPVNSKLHPNEIAYILQDSGSKLCLTDSGLFGGLDPISKNLEGLQMVDVDNPLFAQALAGPLAPQTPPADQNGDTPAWLFYTSGTTGRPKGVVLSHANLVNMALNFYADVQPVDDTDVLLHAAPMSHGSGLYSVPCFLKGALQVVTPSGGFDEAETCALLEAYRNVSLFAAPTIVQRLTTHVAAHPTPLKGLRTIIAAGAPFYVSDIKAAVRVLGPRIAQIYGQGESPMSITAQTARQIATAIEQNDDDYLSSVGHAQSSIEVTIEDTSGNPLGADQAGEIMVAGPTVMKGYWQNPAATEHTLVRGKLRTGDIGLLDNRGLLHLKDRSKDVIISGGSNIYPREVEEALMQHPDVAEVSVIGMPDPLWGEAVIAFVVSSDKANPPSPSALDEHCLNHIARFKRPKQYFFVANLPKNATGKVLKRELHTLIPSAS